MERRSQDRVVKTGHPRRRGFVSRLLTLGALGMTALIVLAACGPDGEKPYSTISPASPQGEDIQSLYKLVFWLSLVVFVGVQFAIVYASLRFRRSRDSAERPPQIHGSTRLEIIWTVIPAVVLLILLIPTITTLYDHDAQAKDGDIVVDVYGKQWWWEVQYGASAAQDGQDLGVVTANEIWLPVGKKAQINLYSNNVIHSFWVPRLYGKLDVIPGHKNTLAITPTEVGRFEGECAEYCGTQHAWMRFAINVVPEDEFYAWVNNWRTAPPASARPDADTSAGIIKAPDVFAACLGCHRVNGTEGAPLPEGLNAPANIGPNLTMVACREVLAGGVLKNTPENMAQWLKDPDSVKPGNYMADMVGPGKALDLSDEQVQELVDYLESMKPAGGCSDAQGWAGGLASPEASPETSPVATPEAGS